MSALAEGEDYGEKLYAKLDGLSEDTRVFVQHELVPQQRRTHEALIALRATL